MGRRERLGWGSGRGADVWTSNPNHPRETTERPEVVDAGFGTLVGSDYQVIVAGVRKLTAGNRPELLPACNPFGHGDSSETHRDVSD